MSLKIDAGYILPFFLIFNPPGVEAKEEEPPDPRDYLRNLTTEKEYKILFRIAKCESGWENIPNYLYDGEDGRYTAYGPFQILKSTAGRYSEKDRRDVYTNIDIAVKLYRAEGTNPWNESRSCWIKKF